MERVESLADDGVRPDGGHPGEGQGGCHREDRRRAARNAEPSGRVERDEREHPRAGSHAESGEEVDLEGAIAEGDEVAEESGKDRPERVAGGVHHPEVEGGRRHLSVIVEADVRHDGAPVGHQGDQEADQGDEALVAVKDAEGMDPLLGLGGCFGNHGGCVGRAHGENTGGIIMGCLLRLCGGNGGGRS